MQILKFKILLACFFTLFLSLPISVYAQIGNQCSIYFQLVNPSADPLDIILRAERLWATPPCEGAVNIAQLYATKLELAQVVLKNPELVPNYLLVFVADDEPLGYLRPEHNSTLAEAHKVAKEVLRARFEDILRAPPNVN